MPTPPTFYSASDRAISELHALLEHTEVPEHYKTVINVLIELQLLNRGNPIKRAALVNKLKGLSTSSKIGFSPAAMTSREKEMISLGVMVDEAWTHEGKNARLKTLKKLTPLMSSAVTKKFTSVPRTIVSQKQVQLAFEELDQTVGVLQPTGSESSRIDALFTGVLDGMVRLSRKDKRKVIEGNYTFGSETVYVKTQTLSGANDEILELSDYRVIRALDEMFVRFVEKEHGEIKRMSSEAKKAVKGDFVFDIFDLCQELGMARTANSATAVRKILRRLATTEFQLTAEDAPDFRSKFMMGAHEMNIRYLTESRVYKDYQPISDDGTVVDFVGRLYLIRFHSSVLFGLLNDTTRHIAHPGLVRDRSGIAHRFNNWCKVVIGVRPGSRDVVRHFLLDELWERMLASSRLDNFCTYFTNLLARECVDGEGAWSADQPSRSLIYGYYVDYNPNPDEIRERMRIKGRRKRPGGKLYPLISIWRDPEDSIVGDNSAHNLALRRIAAELEGVDHNSDSIPDYG